ncbi:MAG: sodium:solute symporter family protein [Deltaproteobacteria bacterium]|nr:sodium:solute symporter family protein [Deltaproteobacteria bacterium]
MSWGLLNLITLAVYLAFMVWLGILSERGGQSDSASGFLLAGRSVTLPWIIMSVFATGVGTLAYIGTVGMIATGGVIDLWYEWFWCVGTPIMTMLFVRKMRTSGIISFLDSIAFRFGPKTLLAYVLFMLVGVPFAFASMLKGAGLTFTDMFPVIKEVEQWGIDPLAIGAIAVLLTIAAYLAFGGFKAAVVTDMLQGILTWAAMIVPTIAIFYILGEGSWSAGWDVIVGYFDSTDQHAFLEYEQVLGPTAPSSEYTYSFMASQFLLNVLLIMIPSQFYGSRYMAATTEKVARQGPILALILTTVPYGLFVNITGLSFKAFAPDIPGDDLFTGTLRRLAEHPGFPMLASSLLLIALLAAVMGTLDSYLMAKMTDWVRGLYQLWINPAADDRQMVRASRVILLILVVTAISASFVLPDSIWFLQIAVSEFVGPMSFILVFGAFLVKRATWQGALSGALVAAFLALVYVILATGFRGQYEWMIWPAFKAAFPDWFESQFFTYPIGLIIFWLVNSRFAPQRPEHLERFFTTQQTTAYVQRHGFDRPYVLVPRGTKLEEGLEVKPYADETRVYGEPGRLAALAEEHGTRVMPAYRPLESWEEVFDERLKGMYLMGLDVARQREADQVGAHERPAAKVMGWAMIILSMIIYFFMFWFFPLEWGKALVLYGIGSVFCFVGLSVAFEDYEWARRLVDPFQARPRVQGVGEV